MQLNYLTATVDLHGMARITKKAWEYITSEALWDYILVASIKVIVIMAASYIAVRVGQKVIEKVFLVRMRSPINHSERRQKTILKLLQSVLSYLVYFSAIMGILSALDIQIAGLLAGAGIAGLAIGFGAQSLVKDVITGFFIIFEDQFGVGDYIQISGAEGTVLEIGLRTTKVKGNAGEQFIIPNGSITNVKNYSINHSKFMIDMQLNIDADIEKAEKLITAYLEQLPQQHPTLTNTPVFLGVQNIADGEVTVRIIAETLPLKQWEIARTIRQEVKELLQNNGIATEFPKMMLYDRVMGREIEGRE
ncbi:MULTISPECIES: mechanosensitive ion channel family protein [Bacillales]|uniref:Mechanosensitive ion channel family protein n=1 Tax=Lysinibacillus louembei TaxID=1470088 RepID=A0ABZ0S1A8_9BACI|nr:MULTISPECIES: mechanosensitive ion channel family protein [Bacillales]MCT6926117.1 mechanosensitive ion channel family protein [Metasolibacillus sp.]MCT6942316.1 mechanosensitive ion channel family protein [Metasolibacillus sp.]WPK13041.1 mechanosensitive ion channel family protein [Lysinibacillus louembei]